MGCIVGGSVHKRESHGQPFLFDLGVGIRGGGIVSVNFSEQVKSDLRSCSLEGIIEDNFQVAVEGEVVLIVCWA